MQAPFSSILANWCWLTKRILICDAVSLRSPSTCVFARYQQIPSTNNSDPIPITDDPTNVHVSPATMKDNRNADVPANITAPAIANLTGEVFDELDDLLTSSHDVRVPTVVMRVSLSSVQMTSLLVLSEKRWPCRLSTNIVSFCDEPLVDDTFTVGGLATWSVGSWSWRRWTRCGEVVEGWKTSTGDVLNDLETEIQYICCTCFWFVFV